MSVDCGHYHEDGCGHYCKAIDIASLKEAKRVSEEYPHRYWRVLCFGNGNECPFRSLYVKKEVNNVHN